MFERKDDRCHRGVHLESVRDFGFLDTDVRYGDLADLADYSPKHSGRAVFEISAWGALF